MQGAEYNERVKRRQHDTMQESHENPVGVPNGHASSSQKSCRYVSTLENPVAGPSSRPDTMQVSYENPVNVRNGHTSSSQQSDRCGSTAENAVAEPSSGRSMHKRRSLPRESKRILEQWRIDHSDNPYPTEEEYKRLAVLTNLTVLQVENWLINARRRNKCPSIQKVSARLALMGL